MKPTFFAMILFAAFSIILTYSCSKESIILDSNSTVKEEKIIPRDWGINRQWYDNGNPDGQDGVDYGCRTPPISCYDDIVVTGPKLSVTNDIFSHNNVWNVGELEGFAVEYSTELNDIIGSSQTSGVRAGTYTLKTRGSALTDHRYIMVRNGSSIVSVTSIDN